jgi:2-succinyl-5-enolpyruvyl-6-hydroxy-3-cyclohexene-1-carboxylate synthase
VQQDDHRHSLTPTTDTYLLLRAFVDELCRCGMTEACTSPGSRSAPLVLTLARESRLRAHSHIDERAAGFFALGLAKASGRPVAIACTSGTAAANLMPAVIEAHEARVPLIVLTADRPPELRDSGAGQTIDQLKLYGGAVRWFVEVGTHDVSAGRLRWMRALACRAYWTAIGERAGPVHLNFPLREPLVPDGSLPADETGRAHGAPRVSRVARRGAASGEPLRAALRDAQRPVIVAGREERDAELAGTIAAFAQRAGVPLLADPLSGARRGAAAIAHYDLMLREAAFAQDHAPDLVVRVGDLPTSKALRAWLAESLEATQIAIDPEGAWQDPTASVGLSLAEDPGPLLGAEAASGTVSGWLDSWRGADGRAATAIAGALDGISEPLVARVLAEQLSPRTTLFVASSMPVRDVESFWPALDDPPRVLANRGANGIDGTISTALGVAAASDGPVVALVGDVALAHDIGGLLGVARLGVSLTIVLLNNGGGGIFDFLPVSEEVDVFEQHVATPTGLDFARVAALYRLRHERPETVESLRAALAAADGATLIEVTSDRAENVRLHRRVAEAVAAAI